MTALNICSDTVLNRAELRRRKLVETARKLFIENGFHATGIAQIAQQSGIAVGQIYRDFASKEEIVAALVTEDCSRYMEMATLEGAIARGDRKSVIAWFHRFVLPDDDLEGGRMFAEIVAESSRNPRIAAILLALQDELRGQMLKALELFAPGPEHAAQREVAADTVVTFSLGLLQYQLFRPSLDIAPLVESLQATIGRQIEELGSAQTSNAPGGPARKAR